jgi:release factor glutamine methyltransferase
MVDIAKLLAQAAEALQSASDTPRLDAEVLLAHVTGKDRSHFRAWPERVLDDAAIEDFRTLLEKRRRGMPVAYLTGVREFWSRPFRVSEAVLIPRPETELLVELALPLCRQGRPCILDLGTGSGILAVTLALEIPGAEVTALDISDAALQVARFNAEALGAGRVQFLTSDWFAALSPEVRFDLIVANPPYIAGGDAHLGQGDVRFEPAQALSSGPDGLDALRRITGSALAFLAEGGWLAVEHGYDQAAEAAALFTAQGFTRVASHRDLQGNPRVTLGQRPRR